MKKKGRKRTVESILNEYNTSSSSASNKFSIENIKIATRKPRAKVQCFCSKCNGKLVDPRTKNAHEHIGQTTSLNSLHSEQLTPLPIAILPNETNETPMAQLLIEPLDSAMEDEENSAQTIIDNNDEFEESIFTFLSRKRKKADSLRRIIKPTEGDFENSSDSDDNTEDGGYSDEDTINNDEILNNFENYSHPIFDLPDISKLPKQDQNVKILIWIMKFRSNFNLPNTATEILIKFFNMFLEECGSEYESFPESLYLARQTLGLVDQFVSFAACKKCHKLYKKDDVTDIRQQTVMKCSHVEFPNSTTKRLKQCQTPLGKKITLNKSISIMPELVYPVASIRQQLSCMFLRPGFEESLRHWINRTSPVNVLSDIYDGRVWRNFKESSEQGSDNFFRPDKADT